MRKLMRIAALFAAAAVLFTGCGKDDETDPTGKPAAPAITLENGDIDAPQEITSPMSVKVKVEAKGKIKDFTISIDSPALTPEVLAEVGLSANMNLATPASETLAEALTTLGFPVGNKVVGQTALSFDISTLVPMIAALYDKTSDHKFTLAVTDASSQVTTKTLTFHLTGKGEMPAAPAITLENADIDAPQEIISPMSVKVNVAAAGKIEDFTISIDSPALTPEILAEVGLSVNMNLATPASETLAEALTTLGFPVGDKVVGQTALSFDISTLVPMIAALYNKTSDHKFTLAVTDASEQTTTKTLTFHLTGPAVTYNDDADLWANTATLKAEKLPEGAKVQYRVKDAAEWNDAVLVEGVTYRIDPVWEASKNDAQLDIHTIKAGTGVFAATSYELRAVLGDEVLASGAFTTAGGDKVPNGDMSGWSKKNIPDSQGTPWLVTYPNAEGGTFWDSGNNMFLEQYDKEGNATIYTPLCSEENGAAFIRPQLALGSVFAAGNMFTGFFDYSGFSGTAKFGQPYTWTARPRALKVRYQATVGLIDKFGSSDPADKADYMGKQDRSCIFVAVVNWEGQHGVTSGMVTPSGMWNPADAASFAEGPVLGYGQQIITESNDAWVELTIPVAWYDKAAANPSSANFSLVISCATSMRGDYLTGCSTNKMLLDDFEWVY